MLAWLLAGGGEKSYELAGDRDLLACFLYQGGAGSWLLFFAAKY